MQTFRAFLTIFGMGGVFVLEGAGVGRGREYPQTNLKLSFGRTKTAAYVNNILYAYS